MMVFYKPSIPVPKWKETIIGVKMCTHMHARMHAGVPSQCSRNAKLFCGDIYVDVPFWYRTHTKVIFSITFLLHATVDVNFLLVVGATCSSVVRVFTRGAMGRRIDPSWGEPIELFLVPASALRLV